MKQDNMLSQQKQRIKLICVCVDSQLTSSEATTVDRKAYNVNCLNC